MTHRHQFFSIVKVFVLIIFYLKVTQAQSTSYRDMIYKACSRNNDIYIADIKVMTTSLKKEMEKLIALNLEEETGNKRLEEIFHQIQDYYEDELFKRRQSFSSSRNVEVNELLRITQTFKHAAVMRTLAEVIRERQEMTDARITRKFVTNCEMLALGGSLR